MIIPTLGNGQLYHVHRNKDRWLTVQEKRKAFGYMIAITILLTIAVLSWIIRPVPSFDKDEPVVQTQQGDR